jgi:hypothetical protein
MSDPTVYNTKYNDDIEALLERDLESVSKDYSAFKDQIIKLDTHSNMINAADRFREKKLNYNENEITKLTKDSNTLRRQVEISQDSSKRKTDWIGILRIVFLYLSVEFLLLIYLRCGKTLMVLTVCLTLLLFIVIGNKLWNFIRRDKNRWDVIRWNVDKKKLPGGNSSNNDVDTCLMSEEDTNAVDTYENTKKELRNNIIALETQIIQMGDSGKALQFKHEELAKQKANLEKLIRDNKQAIANKTK